MIDASTQLLPSNFRSIRIITVESLDKVRVEIFQDLQRKSKIQHELPRAFYRNLDIKSVCPSTDPPLWHYPSIHPSVLELSVFLSVTPFNFNSFLMRKMVPRALCNCYCFYGHYHRCRRNQTAVSYAWNKAGFSAWDAPSTRLREGVTDGRMDGHNLL